MPSFVSEKLSYIVCLCTADEEDVKVYFGFLILTWAERFPQVLAVHVLLLNKHTNLRAITHKHSCSRRHHAKNFAHQLQFIPKILHHSTVIAVVVLCYSYSSIDIAVLKYIIAA